MFDQNFDPSASSLLLSVITSDKSAQFRTFEIPKFVISFCDDVFVRKQ